MRFALIVATFLAAAALATPATATPPPGCITTDPGSGLVKTCLFRMRVQIGDPSGGRMRGLVGAQVTISRNGHVVYQLRTGARGYTRIVPLPAHGYNAYRLVIHGVHRDGLTFPTHRIWLSEPNTPSYIPNGNKPGHTADYYLYHWQWFT
jgi:hypothetical protein